MALPHLKNTWVLVTGAASGIGLETAQAFARAGAHLVITDVNETALQALQRDIAQTGAQCLAYRLDVSDEAAVQTLAREVESRTAGALHVLVNNAGIAYLGDFLDTPTDIWRRILDVNVMGTVHLTQAFLPAMLAASGPRHVVNVASAAGISPAPNLSAYAASKHAVMGLNDTLSMELAGTNVSVTVVCPGVINTPIVRNRGAVATSVPDRQLDLIEKHYRTQGAHPSVVAERIVKAVRTGEDIVLVGPTARLIFHAKRVSRGLVRRATIDGCKHNGYYWAPLRARR